MIRIRNPACRRYLPTELRILHCGFLRSFSLRFHLHRKLSPAPIALKFDRDPVVSFIVREFGELTVTRTPKTALHVDSKIAPGRVRFSGFGFPRCHLIARSARSPSNIPTIVFPSAISPRSIIAMASTSGMRRSLIVCSPSSNDCPCGDFESSRAI